MVTDEEFRSAMSRFASGVTVMTTADAAGRPHGITVSAFCSGSMTPPMVLACIHKETASHYAFLERAAFVVHILGEHQRQISQQFAEPAMDKFDGTQIYESTEGLPMLADALVTLECSVASVHDAGDHTIIVGIVENADIRSGAPLIYYHHDYRKIKD
ncbi:MAG: flavin reductase family protein [Acidobacteria bacterium]|nr:flavin reductase family protein [Acidobacteriota bacterium]